MTEPPLQTTRRRLLHASMVLAGCLAAACNKGGTEFIPTPVPVDARLLTVTLDSCGCPECRVALSNPTTGEGLYNRSGGPIGVAAVAASCYSGKDLRLIVECGSCAGGAPCGATASVSAGGTTPTPFLQAACQTLATPGADCQDDESVTIGPSVPTVNCGP
ncbi:MAG TPA: hypothetical protein VFT43_12590 [Candidatus Polarisedimenticolia bacterium]|nr:hypothetical protein [Candidatus Polarisedimenticolia bacterium]